MIFKCWSLVYSIWRIHTNSFMNIEKILNRPITKFYNGNGVNLIEAELRLTSFYKKQNILSEIMPRNVCMIYCKLYLANYIKLLRTASFELINYQLLIFRKLPWRTLSSLFIKLYKRSADGCFLVYLLIIII